MRLVISKGMVMSSKRLFYLPGVVLVLLSVVCLIAYSSLVRNWLDNQVQANLTQQAQSIARSLEKEKPIATPLKLYEFIYEHGLVGSNRVSLISRDGDVLADSGINRFQLKSLPSHADRSEVLQALAEGVGIAVRRSEVLDENLMYVAVPVSYLGFDGVARVAIPLSRLENMVRELDFILAALLLVMITLVSGLAFFTNRSIQRQIAKQHASLEHQVEHRTSEIELIQRLANMLAACNTLEEAEQVTSDVLPRLLGDVNGAVSMMRASRNQLEIKLDWGGEWPGDKTFSPDECWALRKGKHHLSYDKHTKLICPHMHSSEEVQTLCIPLIAHGNTIGLMHLYLEEEVSEEWMQLAFTVAEHLGLALANLNLQQKLREQALRDPLTGLSNRRAFEEAMSKTLMRSERYQQPMSLLMADMDHFKRFNDNFGHDAGDYVLKSLATLLIDNVRGDDIVCRIGGEEIAIILPNTSEQGAKVIAEKLLDAVRELALTFNKMSLGKLTLSIGGATFPHSGTRSTELIKLADEALYRAKHSGRDRYCADAEFEEGGVELVQPAQNSPEPVDTPKLAKSEAAN